MSRVLGDRRPGPSARASSLVAPVGAGRVDVVGGQDFPGLQLDDGDGSRVGEGENFPAAVGDADAEVVHPPGVANADASAGPELADIRRFTSEWEKNASLRLRRGDTDVIDLYDE